ncbi:Histone deacetylase-like amidohydrolase [Methylacidimicrobium cyclopophantes]|uniref:Histone deacetylase-like amidohydrolase n=1 Tax=Methylacidimicrobium cyclopophantes TaxID=1041766 RepID=A0A5E6MBP6_9BACT|nr:histone deacetylase [Methylacidimicrobium cyclopophantes]VVM06648.1 Histone deacetylase-like amidohydrolase [Methylacidimicrobium cyclopophantes]
MSLPTLLVTHSDFARHPTPPGHPESPGRITATLPRLRACLPKTIRWLEPEIGTSDLLRSVHAESYIERIEKLSRDGLVLLDEGDTFAGLHSYETALLAIGAAATAIDRVASGEAANAFALVRPPGHHARPAAAMGFCLFNTVAAAARYAQKKYGYRRILIVDWDLHHGNGTQEIFEEDPSVFFLSLHEYPLYPGTGRASERGKGEGEGFTLNLPMKAGSGDAEYGAVFREQVVPAADAFRPDFVLVSAGFDAHREDPLGNLMLSERGFAEMTMRIREVAERHCRGKLVSVLEGGYNLDALARCIDAHLCALEAKESPPAGAGLRLR